MCDELWDLQLSKGEMHKIAARFGSDINFFLEGGVAYLTGRGERVSNIPSMLEVKNLLLVNPYIKISSREAYSWVKVEAEKREKLERIMEAIARNNIPILCQNMYNSLEDGVFLRYPVIKEIKEKMLDFGAVGSLMSGSGATVFGIFDSKDEIKSAENYFKGLDFWTYRTGIDT
jgi:4-diphosphocytidyl-2-C-methyl-D-erythritol kinase